jgi:hypothetical protein
MRRTAPINSAITARPADQTARRGQARMASGQTSGRRAALVCYRGLLLIALRVVQPRNYKHYHHNLTRMRQEVQQMIMDKVRPLRGAGILR